MLVAAPGQPPLQGCGEYGNAAFVPAGAMANCPVMVPSWASGVVFAVPADQAHAVQMGTWHPVPSPQLGAQQQSFTPTVDMQQPPTAGVEVAPGVACAVAGPCGCSYMQLQPFDCSAHACQGMAVHDGSDVCGLQPAMGFGMQAMPMPMIDGYQDAGWQTWQEQPVFYPDPPQEYSNDAAAAPGQERSDAASAGGKVFVHTSDGGLQRVGHDCLQRIGGHSLGGSASSGSAPVPAPQQQEPQRQEPQRPPTSRKWGLSALLSVLKEEGGPPAELLRRERPPEPRMSGKIFLHDSDGGLRHVAQCSRRSDNGRMEVNVMRNAEEPAPAAAAQQKSRQARAPLAGAAGNGSSTCSGSDSPSLTDELSSVASSRSLASSASSWAGKNGGRVAAGSRTLSHLEHDGSRTRGVGIGSASASASERPTIAPPIRIAQRGTAIAPAGSHGPTVAAPPSAASVSKPRQHSPVRWAGRHYRIAPPTTPPPPPPPDPRRGRRADVKMSSASSSCAVPSTPSSNSDWRGPANTGIAGKLPRGLTNTGIAGKLLRGDGSAPSWSPAHPAVAEAVAEQDLHPAAADAVMPASRSPAVEQEPLDTAATVRQLSRAVLQQVYTTVSVAEKEHEEHSEDMQAQCPSEDAETEPTEAAIASGKQQRKPALQPLQRPCQPPTRSERKQDRRRGGGKPAAPVAKPEEAAKSPAEVPAALSQPVVRWKVIAVVVAATVTFVAALLAFFSPSSDGVCIGPAPGHANRGVRSRPSGGWVGRVVLMPLGSSKFAWPAKAMGSEARDEQSVGTLIRRLDIEGARAVAAMRSKNARRSPGSFYGWTDGANHRNGRGSTPEELWRAYLELLEGRLRMSEVYERVE